MSDSLYFNNGHDELRKMVRNFVENAINPHVEGYPMGRYYRDSRLGSIGGGQTK